MVSRYDPNDDLNIWEDDPELDTFLQNAIDDEKQRLNTIKPDKITPKLADKIKALRPVYPDKDDIYEQLEDFIKDWTGDIYVLPSELFSLYKNYCKENNEKCLILSGQGFGRRLTKFVENKTITRTVLNHIPYYCKSSAIKTVEVMPEQKVVGKKRKREDSEGSVSAKSGDQTLCDEYIEQLPKKKRRTDDLTTWAAAKEAEEFTLKISILESQVKSLSDICRRQKEIITRLTATQ